MRRNTLATVRLLALIMLALSLVVSPACGFAQPERYSRQINGFPESKDDESDKIEVDVENASIEDLDALQKEIADAIKDKEVKSLKRAERFTIPERVLLCSKTCRFRMISPKHRF